MDGGWTGNTFLLGCYALANYGGISVSVSTTYLPTNNPPFTCVLTIVVTSSPTLYVPSHYKRNYLCKWISIKGKYTGNQIVYYEKK
jgi:hypothetical protein